MRRKKYISLLNPFEKQITKRVLQVNPTIAPLRKEPAKTIISVYEYNATGVTEEQLDKVEDCYKYLHTPNISWINLDGLKKTDIDKVCTMFGIHPLIAEDIFSSGQRPKMDDLNQLLFCLLNMLYFNVVTNSVESEQVSLVLGANFVLSFQEDASRDVFNPLREKIKTAGSKVRQSGGDYLFYSLIDMIVDNYFVIMEQLGEKIEGLEEDITQRPDNKTLAKINMLRKEMIFLKRNISPVREMVNGILRSESYLIEGHL